MISPKFFAAGEKFAGFSQGENPSGGSRFTLDGSADLENHLSATCTKIAAAIWGLIPPSRLQAAALGGGYGRGEGGVLRTAQGDRPYNDLEFYVFVRGNRHLNERRFGRALHVLGEILTKQAGVDVEFKIASLAELSRAPVSMYSYDLLAGHRLLFGNPQVFATCAHHLQAGRIPLAEATRLMMNRCSGLLFARERLEQAHFTAGDADFVRRNIAKAQLALGDAVLTAFHSYHWSAAERQRLLAGLAPRDETPWLAAVQQHHAIGVAFKLHPERSGASRDELVGQHRLVANLARDIWLWLEGRRLGQAFPRPRDYAVAQVDKCPEMPAARNALINVRLFGPAALKDGELGRHPRSRIFHALTLLLWEPEALRASELLSLLGHELCTDAATFPEIMSAYRRIWERVN